MKKIAKTISLLMLIFAFETSMYPQSLSWTQWSKDPQHTGEINVAGQGLNTVLADIIYDPFVDIEKNPANGDGDLFVHYQTPLVDGDDMFMEFKSGTYTSITTGRRRPGTRSGSTGRTG